MAPATVDPRAERTKELIFSAIRYLMAQGKVAVTVGDVARTAGISRSSFYAHFASLDEVASELLRTQFATIPVFGGGDSAADRSPGAARAGLALLVDHLVESFPLYSSVLELPLTRSVYDEIVEAYARRLLDTIELLDDLPEGVDPELASRYVAGGEITLISAWMRGHIVVSDDELVDQLASLLPAWLAQPSPTGKIST